MIAMLADNLLSTRIATSAEPIFGSTYGPDVTVSFEAADIIIGLEGGKMVEMGSHAELMSAPRLYAEPFTLQSRAYQ